MEEIVKELLMKSAVGYLPLRPDIGSQGRSWAAKVLASFLWHRGIICAHPNGAVLHCVTSLGREFLEEIGITVLADPAFGPPETYRGRRWVRLFSPISGDDWGAADSKFGLDGEERKVLKHLAQTSASAQ
jgi:hypothetical protein